MGEAEDEDEGEGEDEDKDRARLDFGQGSRGTVSDSDDREWISPHERAEAA